MAVCAQNSASSQAAAAGRSHLLPAIEESPFVPVPEEVREHLWMTVFAFVDRDLDAAAHKDVTPLAQRHLHLGNDVPLGSGIADQLTRGHDFDDRCPRP